MVKEQITRALSVQPRSLEVFKNRLQTLTYQDILKLWEQDRQTKEEWESQAQPIMLVYQLFNKGSFFRQRIWLRNINLLKSIILYCLY